MTCRGVVFVCPHRLYSKRGGRLIAAPTGVIPFNRTGCIRDVAGGRLPMNECVIAPGNHWFLIRCAEHHPYGFADTFYLCAIVPTMRNAARPSQSPAVTVLPKGEPRVPFRYVFPLRPLFLQYGTPYCTSSTAYGGPPSPKGKVMGVIPFNHTSSIRYAPGTAHRPFPTVSLVGVFLNQRIPKGPRPFSITVNCQLSTKKSEATSKRGGLGFFTVSAVWRFFRPWAAAGSLPGGGLSGK